MILLAGIRTVSVLCIELRLECNARATGLECFLGNIDPHAESSSLKSVCNVTENDGFANVEENVVRPACKSSIGIVKFPCKRIVAVSDRSAVCKRRNKCLTAEVFVELTCERSGANKSVVYTVVLRPLLRFLKSYETCLVAILEIEDNLGALTELDCILKHGFTVSYGNVNTCDGCIIGSCELEAVKSTCIFVRKSNGNCIGINVHVCLACHSNDRKRDCTNLLRGRIRNHSRGCGKCKYLGIGDCNGLRTYNCAAGDNLNIYVSCLAAGSKLSKFNSTKGSVRNRPRNVSRHIHCITVSINSLCAEGILGVGGKDLIVRIYVNNVKNSGRSNVRSNENTVCGRTLCAVTGNRTHSEVLFTYTLGDKCGRSAAVTVSSPHTAESEHCLAFFIGAKANRIVRTTTVVHTNNEGTVFLNADHRTSCIVIAALFGRIYKSAVFDNHTERNTNCVK